MLTLIGFKCFAYISNHTNENISRVAVWCDYFVCDMIIIRAHIVFWISRPLKLNSLIVDQPETDFKRNVCCF